VANVICFDIDGVLTIEAKTDYQDLAGTYIYRGPNLKAKAVMDKAYDSGWTVVLYTGRREVQRRITEDWLYSHKFHYHFLIMNKPYYSLMIDDRTITLENFDEMLDFSYTGCVKSSDIPEVAECECGKFCSDNIDAIFKDISSACIDLDFDKLDSIGIKLSEFSMRSVMANEHDTELRRRVLAQEVGGFITGILVQEIEDYNRKCEDGNTTHEAYEGQQA